jgi:hypothetical protein
MSARNAFIEALQERDVRLAGSSSPTEIADCALMTKLAQSGFGTTLIPASAAAAAPGRRSVPAADSRLRWSLSAATSASRRPTAATTALLRAVTQASAPSPANDTFSLFRHGARLTQLSKKAFFF